MFLTPPHPAGYDRLMEAVEAKNPTLVETLLDSGINPNVYPNADADLQAEDDYTVLNVAVDTGDLEIVKILLDHGADPNMGDGWHHSPLIAAAEKGSEMMTLLIEKGAKVNDGPGGSSALWDAAKSNRIGALKFLLDHGANPNTHSEGRDPETILHMLRMDLNSHGRQAEAIRVLKEHGARG